MKTRSQTAAVTTVTAVTTVNDMVSMFDRWKLPL